MLFDTIVGKASANGISAINIIRVSGDDAIFVVNKVFRGTNLENVKSHTTHYGFIMDDDFIIDEVMVSVFRAPKSFTRENVVEISCHGGNFISSEIIKVLMKNGCRLAERGEFTERAFLNGRIDLTEAESIMDMIEAKTRTQLKVASSQLTGQLSKLILDLQNQILDIVAQIEVNIDYPEYDDVVEMTTSIIIPKIHALLEQINIVLQKSNTGKVIRDGIQTVIIGKPNVGKSSLLNSLLKEERAIVTDISGTTRDLIEAELNLDGIILKLVDTAGIRETVDFVEKIGIEKAKKALQDAELVLLVLDQSEELTPLDMELLNITKDKPRIIVGNKMDLGQKATLKNEEMIQFSAKNNEGIESLTREVKKKFIDESIITNNEAVLSNVRHISKLEETKQALIDALNASYNSLPIDMVEMDLRKAWSSIGEITGNNTTEDLISTLFRNFCLGK